MTDLDIDDIQRRMDVSISICTLNLWDFGLAGQLREC